MMHSDGKQPAAGGKRGVTLADFRYPANILTAARLLLLWPTLHYLRRPETRWHALACIGAAMFTDAIDGPLARSRGETSDLGRVLDPVIDKLVIDSVAVQLARTRGFPRWMVALLLFRDAGILLAALFVYQQHTEVTPAQTAGKVTTVSLTAALLLYTLDGERVGKPALYVALIPFLLSFVQYGSRFLHFVHRQEK
jgi:CDP-diacylglycerol--glycerol-3-phosphate 3-phosphatidyltransferase